MKLLYVGLVQVELGDGLTVQLDRAGGTPNQYAVPGEYGKGAGLLVGERL